MKDTHPYDYAFPVAPGDVPYWQPGMSLRDYFAGQALAGMCNGFTGASGDAEWFEQVGANAAYKIADAMIKTRKGGAQ